MTAPLTAAGVGCVALGGGAGAVLRYFAGRTVRAESGFPVGTLAVNVTGCLAFGLLAAALGDRLGENWRLLIFTGILGGYTTFSAFGGETFALGRERPASAALYVALSVGLGLSAVALGHWLGQSIVGPRGASR